MSEKRKATNASKSPAKKKFKSKEEELKHFYQTQLNQYTKDGNADEAFNTLKQAKENKVIITPSMCAQVLNLCTTVEQFPKAKEIHDIMKADKIEFSENCLTPLIKLYSLKDDYNTAKSLYTQILYNHLKPRLRTYQPLLSYCSSHKLPDDIEYYYNEILNNDIELNHEVYLPILECYDLINDKSKFHSTLERMSNSLFSITPPIKDIIQSHYKKEGYNLEECNINNEGICSKCQCKLKSINLEQSEKENLLTQLHRIMTSGNTSGSIRQKSASDYMEFLKAHDDYTVFIDSANVGYYAQNFEKGSFSYYQIDKVYDKLKENGNKCLLLLHISHTNPTNEYLEKWKKSGDLYLVPQGNNDDWYWMYGALSSKLPNVKIVSNDLMRDHFFQMISPKYFKIWRERHEIKYTFRGDINNRYPYFFYPSVYSKRSQFVVDDEKNISSWHFPIITETQNNKGEIISNYQWFCVNYPNK